ncbi:ER-Golgi trafficking TRAPP I complex 85 kDa subunit domain-containing protein [Trichoderma breve]|uniref:ER-Golgi trafficking TRAPP I complex 85 kDa subunit domain-containing protein n=1 Tax=Trichoderma breve TaxID=2034170 RepID=A0A9W9BCL8_9HYPO|nr:ER-Golgi trafficking TRAPP I complex 85 kDa subunit domain-containing protein [Trichoderma breve]KAJ4857488.1 ER-Golgi trafficking TRAPP I complex 85 kDa subunit domain-containing protein [Trichoderma breve]
MPRPQDESSTEPIQALPAAASAAKFSYMRHSTSTIEPFPTSPSDSTLVYRRSTAASLYASTLSPPGSRSMSPAGRGSPSRVLSGTVFDIGQNRGLPDNVGDDPGEPLNLILKSFVPHVAVYASRDTEALIGEKGFQHGLWELLRPFGENIQGKVNIRDSNGVGRIVEDFSIRFTRFGGNIERPDALSAGSQQTQAPRSQNGAQEKTAGNRSALNDIEAVVERHLSYAEESFLGMPHQSIMTKNGSDSETASPYYALYLRRLLSGLPISAHETFAHPVACIIAISSRNPAPIEELRRLYTETSQGEKKLPSWVDGDYLRYYVLVHDEENDDIARSMALFEQMKRHLGLHCHLLRLRCSQSVETDDDSIPLPRSDWMSAAEELAEIRRSENDEDFEDPSRYIFESDATAIRTFIREMVMQSIIPTMERHATIWNDQVASKRKGITGRFMSLSKRWTGFGTNSRSSSSGTSTSKDGYDPSGFYRADTSEAIMRKLADFAFMLRDWRLAHSTYDLLRSDFSESKAWKYHAATNEMAALSLLLMPQQLTSKSRAETVDQMLESAFYSYNTRCSSPYGATRTLILAQELLRLRGGSSIDDAARWCTRLLESKILGNIGDALLKERLAICYASKQGVGSWSWGSRRRKSAAWSVFAARAWAQQSKHIPAQRCLNEAKRMYETLPHGHGISQFAIARETMDSLQHELTEKLEFPAGHDRGISEDAIDDGIDEESEALTDMRSRRASNLARDRTLETAPLHNEEMSKDTNEEIDKEGFE